VKYKKRGLVSQENLGHKMQDAAPMTLLAE